MTKYVGSQDYVGNLQSSWRTPHQSTHPTEDQDSDPLVVRAVHRTRKGRVKVCNERVGVLFFSGMCGVLNGDCMFPS